MAENEFYRLDLAVNITGDEQVKGKLRAMDNFIAHTKKQGEALNRMKASPAIHLTDRFTGAAQRVEQHMQRLHGVADALDRMKIAPLLSIRDNLTSGIMKADQVVKSLDMEQASPVITARDKVSSVVSRINAALEEIDKGHFSAAVEMRGDIINEAVQAKAALAKLDKTKAGPVADLKGELFGQLTKAMTEIRHLDLTTADPKASLRDLVTWKAREIGSTLRGLTSRAWAVTIQAKDQVTNVVKRITGMLTSPLGLLGAGAGAYGLGKLTVGAAAQFEQYTVAMEHWLKGNKALAQETMKWVEEFSDITPFTPEQLFPGMARAINIEKGMVEPAKRLVKLSGEMAALTPGKTVLDAMEALADAQVGEFERMKEFGMKITQEEFKAMGGWAGFLRKAEGIFAGGMQRLSRIAPGLLSTIIGRIQTLFRSAGWGMLEAIEPRLEKIVDWFMENKQTVDKWKNALVRFGRDAFEGILSWGERVFARLNKIIESPGFQKANWGEKIIILLNEMIQVIDDWVAGPGGKQVEKVFVKLAEIGTRAWLIALGGMVKGAGESLLHGNILGGIGLIAGAGLLGGGMLARGAWGLGKGALGLGRRIMGRGAVAGAGVAAETAATAGRASIAGRVLPILGRARPWLGRIGLPIAAGIEAINIASAEDKRTAVISGAGRIAGMIAGGKAGAAAGGAIGGLFGGVGAAPGAVIGGILGGIGGFFGGQMFAEKINTWLDKVDFKALKEKALLMWDDVRQKASDTWENVTAWASGAWEEARKSASSAWNWIKENFTLESIAEKAGYVVGYLESTIFSGEWWGRQWDEVKNWASEKWASMVEVYESAKATIMSTIFSSEWWQGHWESVKDWTSEKWAGMVEIWENTKESLSSTLFSSEWWLEKWSNVKSWTSEKWNEMKTVWETVKSNISSTLFSKAWWESKWENVKTWASGALDGITARWEELKASFAAGREAGQRVAATKYAVGGILTRPHLGLVAEAGPEAIIPLSPGKRDRAVDIFQKAAEAIGLPKAGNIISLEPGMNIQGRLPGPAEAVGFRYPVSAKMETVAAKVIPLKPEFAVFASTPETVMAGQVGKMVKTSVVEKTSSIINELKKTISNVTVFTSRLVSNIKTVMKQAQTIMGITAPRELMPVVQSISARFGIPPALLSAVIQAESGWNPRAVSPAGAIGLTQIMPGTARAMGYNPAELARNPAIQVEAGAKYLSQMLWRFKSIPLALAAYNAGPGAVEKYGGIPPYKETQAYVSRVMSMVTKHETGGIFNKSHIGLVAEAGPEAVIPLSSRLRTRSLELWQQAGEYLGVKPYALGGFTGPVPAVAGAGGGRGGDLNVTVTGITVNMAGNEINEETLAWNIGKRIVKEIKKSVNNRA